MGPNASVKKGLLTVISGIANSPDIFIIYGSCGDVRITRENKVTAEYPPTKDIK